MEKKQIKNNSNNKCVVECMWNCVACEGGRLPPGDGGGGGPADGPVDTSWIYFTSFCEQINITLGGMQIHATRKGHEVL